MDAKTAMSVEEYLHTSFPGVDKEYRDGELVERSMPAYAHGRTQSLTTAFFEALGKAMPLFPCTETRMQVRTGTYLIPDVAVFFKDEPADVPASPPLILIEILSPDDRMNEVREKLQEYRAWGARHVWLVDPYSKRMYTCNGTLVEVASLTVPELGIEVKPGDIFR